MSPNKRASMPVQVCTGVARNFDWEELKMEKFCDVILAT